MINNFIIILLISASHLVFGQNYSYKSKKYGIEVFEYLKKKTEKDSISLDQFIFYSKPFSKWDIRPLKSNKVWAIDTIHSASTIPNFIWGSLAKKYHLTTKEASRKPNDFLNEGILNVNKYSNFVNHNILKFKELSKKTLESSNKIFLNQSLIKRIDNIYKENNTYWSYRIPKDSPFPLSNKIIRLKNTKFSTQQNEILSLLSQLNIYSAYKSNKGIFFLIDGFTDNSYGYFYTLDGYMETDNNLFEIMSYKRINANFFYYTAN
ncbi:hypothetical protein [Aquimarina longa]|uniref:hypothetical protein n=1 Tax=Aquimarina longa TaxID=1080221 RepID=UPI000780FC88|nr:hypothetical protein [Aquimarina longa]